MHASLHPHAIHDEQLIVLSSLLCSSLCSFPCVSPTPCSFLPTSTCTLSGTSSSMRTTPRQTYPASPPIEESCSLEEFTPLIGHEPKLLDDSHYWLLFRGRIQRHGALVLVWRGTRRRDHRQSAVFTTVHSGARRISGPKTSLSLLWRKFVASSVIFRTLKNGETRARTQFAKFVQRKTKSRDGKRNNQDSRWKTKKSKFSLTLEPRFRNMNFKPILIGGSIQELNGIVELSAKRNWSYFLQVMHNFDEVDYFFMNNNQNKIWIFVKLVLKAGTMPWRRCRTLP